MSVSVPLANWADKSVKRVNKSSSWAFRGISRIHLSCSNESSHPYLTLDCVLDITSILLESGQLQDFDSAAIFLKKGLLYDD